MKQQFNGTKEVLTSQPLPVVNLRIPSPVRDQHPQFEMFVSPIKRWARMS